MSRTRPTATRTRTTTPTTSPTRPGVLRATRATPRPVARRKPTGEEDDSERGVSLKRKRTTRVFQVAAELARSVVTFSETAEMLCLLTAGGVRVAQLTQMGRERRLPFQAAAGPKRSVARRRRRGAGAGAALRAIARQGGERRRRRARRRRRRARHARRRLMGRNNVVPLGNVAPAPAGDDAAQFADVVSPRARARRAPRRRQEGPRVLAPAGGDRRQGGGRAASQGAVTPTQTQTQTEPAAAAASGDASASPEPRGSAARGAAGARSGGGDGEAPRG